MTLGEKISLLRKERSLTQAELGKELGVTYQAVSKWERDESMPDFDMISKLARLFGVPISHFENGEVTEENAEVEGAETATVVQVYDPASEAAQKANEVLGVCTVCGKYVNKDNVAVETPKLICNACHAEQQAQAKRAEASKREREQARRDALSSRFIKRSIIAAVVAGLISLTIFIVLLANISSWKQEFGVGAGEYVGIAIAGLVILFSWIFQLFFDGAVRSVTLAGLFFIKLPGIIFSADLNGLIFLVVMKVLFFIITIVVFIGAIIVTSIAAMLLSLVTFIPVIIKIIRRNEDLLGD